MLDPDSVPPPRGRLTRRRLLVGGGRGLLALVVLGGAAACGSNEPAEPDPLEAQLEAARHDRDLAAAAAKGAPPALAPALSEVAAQRGRHATALIEELSRAAGKPTPTATEAASSTSSQTPTVPPPRPPSATDVVAALRRSADSAAALAPTLAGYRAGLMGSIAAACTAMFTVGIPAEKKPPGKMPR